MAKGIFVLLPLHDVDPLFTLGRFRKGKNICSVKCDSYTDFPPVSTIMIFIEKVLANNRMLL